ncbi:MAG: tRNA pseudouridine(55) synthase TruB [Ignavibacterium sp.]|nr:MAG: tRNA pseudouridine(55) synthase TruB [Ignavibacterium sp.]
MVTNKTADLSSLKFVTGETLLIDKPSGWTSFKVVHTIKRAINVRRVGHTGTLDPLATGLLIVLTGRNTKQMIKYQDLDKTYTGVILLGKSSPSMDTETEMTSKELPDDLSNEKIYEIRNIFLGEITQIPPMYSALKVNGRKLYHLARKGKLIKREPRKIHISKFDITAINLPKIHFEITCSKGTYIRVIVNDFGEKLGCGAVLSNLRRTKIGHYDVQDALSVNDFVSKLSASVNALKAF